MKKKISFTIILALLASLVLSPGQALAADDIEVIATRHAGAESLMTTFEGSGDWQEVGEIPELKATFESGWITINSVGGLNNPSPPTIAFVVTNENDIWFEEPVAAVSFYYSSCVPVGLDGLDEDGNILVSACFPANCPSGNFDIWEPAAVTVGTSDAGDNIIKKLRVTGSPGYVAIDDFQITRVYAPPPKDDLIRIDFFNNYYVYYDNTAKTIVLEMSSKWGVAKGGKSTVHTKIEFNSNQDPVENVTSVTIMGDEKDQDGYVKVEPVIIPYEFTNNWWQFAKFTVQLFNPGGKPKGDPLEFSAWILVGSGP